MQYCVEALIIGCINWNRYGNNFSYVTKSITDSPTSIY